jgi:hypothetical protein
VGLAPPLGEVRVRTASGEAVRIELRSPNGTFSAGAIPEGTYDVWADFGRGMYPSGTLQVAAGRATQVDCNRMKFSCTAAP